jgi:hypothetical protein
VAGDNLSVPVMARVIRLSIVRYCSVITTVAGVAAIEATVELLATDGSSTGRRPIELAIPALPALPGIGVAAIDLNEVGVSKPAADED